MRNKCAHTGLFLSRTPHTHTRARALSAQSHGHGLSALIIRRGTSSGSSRIYRYRYCVFIGEQLDAISSAKLSVQVSGNAGMQFMSSQTSIYSFIANEKWNEIKRSIKCRSKLDYVVYARQRNFVECRISYFLFCLRAARMARYLANEEKKLLSGGLAAARCQYLLFWVYIFELETGTSALCCHLSSFEIDRFIGRFIFYFFSSPIHR